MTIQINGTSGISGVDGSAATPALQGTDTNTGISFGTDEVNISTGGVPRAKFDSSGRLLMGTSTARTNYFNAGNTPYVQIEGYPDFSLTRNADDIYGATHILAKTRSSGNTIVQNNDQVGLITFQGNDGSEFVECANIKADIDGTPGANDMPGRLVFSTTGDGASSPTERVRIDQSGVFWHVSSTGYNYYLAKSGAGNTYVAHYISSAEGSGYTYNIYYRDNTNTGSISYNGTGITFNNTSDYRLKENILPINNAIDRVKQLRPSRFNFKSETGFDSDVIDGFIAHEVKDVVPNAVTGEKDAINDDGSIKPQQLDQSKLVPLLTAALQEALAKIETLETRLTALEGGTNS